MVNAPRPLSAAQRALWTAYRMAPAGHAYTMLLSLRIRGRLDTEALASALDLVCRRHEVLRSCFDEVAGEPVRLPRQDPPAGLEIVDVPVASDGSLLDLLSKAARLPFFLERTGPLRALLYRHGDDDFALSLAVHHIAGDFSSYSLLLHELFAVYRSMVAGEEPDLPELTRGYDEYVAEEAAHPGTPAGRRDHDYWTGLLAGAVTTELPTDRPRPPLPSHTGGTVHLDLAALSDDLQQAAKSVGARPFPLLLAAYQALLARWTGEQDIMVGTPASTRARPDRTVFGCYLNSMPVRIRVGADATFASLAAESGRQLLQGMRHVRLAATTVVTGRRGPLVRLGALLLQMSALDAEFPPPAPGEPEGAPAEFAGLRVSRIDEPSQEGQLDLMLTLHQGVHGLVGVLTYDSDLFDHESVEHFARCYERFLRAAADDPGRRVGEVPLTDEDDLAALLALGGA
ncbi:condensation domain-containing protein [Streptomyces sp. NPDC059832]|uniref:condensation domain-containing protein n=1 Tax=unclassified Streptomyces TaxID=2593676 RepID=UPI0036639E03